jgi:hypothetical protein
MDVGQLQGSSGLATPDNVWSPQEDVRDANRLGPPVSSRTRATNRTRSISLHVGRARH